IFLRLGPWRAGSEVERARIRGPGEGVNLLLSPCNRESFAAVGRDQIQLGGIVLLRRIFFLAVGRFTFRQKCDPSPVGRPLRIAVMAGPGELGQSSFTLSDVAKEPQILS